MQIQIKDEMFVPWPTNHELMTSPDADLAGNLHARPPVEGL
jgi:hypothetical protein